MSTVPTAAFVNYLRLNSANVGSSSLCHVSARHGSALKRIRSGAVYLGLLRTKYTPRFSRVGLLGAASSRMCTEQSTKCILKNGMVRSCGYPSSCNPVGWRLCHMLETCSIQKLHGSAVRLLHGSSDRRRHREVVRSDGSVFGHGWIFAEKDDSVVCEQSNGFVVTVLRYQIYS